MVENRKRALEWLSLANYRKLNDSFASSSQEDQHESFKRDLITILKLNCKSDTRTNILCEIYYMTYIFCREKNFGLEESMMMLYIVQHILEKDMFSFYRECHMQKSNNRKSVAFSDSSQEDDNDSKVESIQSPSGIILNNRTIDESLTYLQYYLLNFCVDYPPERIMVYSAIKAMYILNFFKEKYYRQFRLYKYVLSELPDSEIVEIITAPVKQSEEVTVTVNESADIDTTLSKATNKSLAI